MFHVEQLPMVGSGTVSQLYHYPMVGPISGLCIAPF